MTDLEIEINNIWTKDKLNRKGYADFLYKIIESAQTSEEEDNALIFAIDGEWGTGKSFFIDLWIKDLKAKGHLVSRFDAWKNDIVDEPLVGFLSHIYADLGEWDKGDVVTVVEEKIKQSQKLLLPLAKELLKGAAIKGLGTLVTDEAAKEVVKAIAEGHDKVAEDEVKDEQSMSSMLIHRQLQAHNKNLQLIEDFKNKLSETAKSVTEKGDKKFPVFIFIDELDRCRPDYAVRLLEVVKHIFNSKGICFISSVNIDQLQQSIKTIYGMEFKADLYLDRFFSHRLKLPAPSVEDYIKSLNCFKKIKDNKTVWGSGSGSVLHDFEVGYVKFYELLCVNCNFDLRTIKTIFEKLDICRKILMGDEKSFQHDEILFFIICYLRSDISPKSLNPRLIISSNKLNIGNCDYFYHRESYGSKYLYKANWGNVFNVINYIFNRYENPRNRIQIDDESYEINDALLCELGGQDKDIIKAIATLQKYVDVCQLSGTLDN